MDAEGHMSTHVSLPPVPMSASQARRFVTKSLHEWRLDDLADRAELIVSELVTNVVLHAQTTLEIRLTRLPDNTVLIEVCDGMDALPRQRRTVGTPEPAEPSTFGRGLLLVEGLATRWGTDVIPTGKRVWAELRV